MANMSFVDCQFRGNTFGTPMIYDCRFRFVSFTRCRFVYGLEIRNCRFLGISNLTSCSGLDTIRIDDADATWLSNHQFDFQRINVSWATRWSSWEIIRAFGQLPLFGVSISAVILIPLLLFALSIYNSQIVYLHNWEAALHASSMAWVAALQPVAMPALTLFTLIGTVLLAIASTLFAVACPARVKEFSLQRWTDELRRPTLHYLAHSWKYHWTRRICMICYVLGGSITATILGIKLIEAALYVLAHTPMPWWWM